MKIKIVCVVGTRPEAIKMAPIILALKKQNWVDLKVLATAQHREILDQVLNFFQIIPDIDLNIMQPNQSLAALTGRLLIELDKFLSVEKPNIIIAQGDTTTVMSVAIAAFYHGVLFGHVEAGLRTWDISNPFPEEMNRVIASRLTHWHFAPTETSRLNLVKENIKKSSIIVTGNTVIDALLLTAQRVIDVGVLLDSSKRLVLVTTHRRENFGNPIKNVCQAIKFLAQNNSDIEVLFPVHPNPNVKSVAHEILADLKNVILCEPLKYGEFIAAMKRAYIIISDSGGVQEEAPALAKPVLVLRDETERPEAVEMGVVKLVGTSFDKIVLEAQNLLDNKVIYKSMAKGVSPYGDGRSAERIVAVLHEYFSTNSFK